MKAINDGTCQICGSRQRLPNGRLAKHGYTTRWGFFSGVCNGSGELPFELSIGLILNAIDRAQAEAAGLRDNAADQRAKGREAESCKTMHSCYLPATFADRQSRHEWRELDIRSEGSSFFVEFETRDSSGRKFQKKHILYGTMATIRQAGREGYALHLENRAGQMDQYAKWQAERIQGWQPAPLLPRQG